MPTLHQRQTIQANYYAQYYSYLPTKWQAHGAWLLPTQPIYVEHYQPRQLSNLPIILPLFMMISKTATLSGVTVQLFGSSGVFRKPLTRVMDSLPWLAWRSGKKWTRG